MNTQRNPRAPRADAEARNAPPCNVILGVRDLEPMKKFYRDVLGFELVGEFPSAALFKVAAANGQTQRLGLLQRSAIVGAEPSLIRQITFALAIANPESERKRLEGLGLILDELAWDSPKNALLSFHDPEGNAVELLCCSPMLDN